MSTDGRSQFQRMVDGDLYNADDPEIQAAQQRAFRLAAEFGDAFAQDAHAAQALLKEFLGTFDDTAHVRAPLHVDYGMFLSIGPRSFVNFGLVALDVAPITIGANCFLGPNIQLLTPTHPLEPELRRQGLEAAEPITIEDNVWIGGGAIVLAGVTIGENSVVGAGAVVTKDVPRNVVVVGSPARVVKSI